MSASIRLGGNVKRCVCSRLETYFEVWSLIDVDSIDEVYFAGAVRHYKRTGPYTFTEEADTFQQRTIGYASSREHDVLARRQVFCPIDLLLIADAHLGNTLFKLWCVDYKTSNDLAVQTTHSGSGDYSFRCASGSHHRMDTSTEHGSSDSGGEITIGDKTNAGAGSADILNQLFVPGIPRGAGQSKL